MPAEIVTMRDCASNYGVFKVPGSRGNVYTVTLHGSEGPAHCTCPAFQYSGEEQHCKHVTYVWERACLFNPQWRDGKDAPALRPEGYTYDVGMGGKCRCGGPLVSVRRAV